MPPRPRSGRRPYPGGQFNDPEHLPDPHKPNKAEQARRAAAQGPPEGFPPAGDTDEPAGEKPTRRAAGGDPSSSPERRVPSAGQVFGGGGPEWSDGGGFLLGLLLTVLGLNYIRQGPAGVKAWFMAKLFNKTSPDPNDGGRTARSAPEKAA